MSKGNRRHNHPCAAEAVVPLPSPLPLGEHDQILVDGTNTYRCVPGSVLRTAPCLVCRRPLGAGPFQLHIWVSGRECPEGDGHIVAAAFARHAQCPDPGPPVAERMIGAALCHPAAT